MAEILKIVGGLVAIGAVVVLFGPAGDDGADRSAEVAGQAVSGASGGAGDTAKFVTVTPDE